MTSKLVVASFNATCGASTSKDCRILQYGFNCTLTQPVPDSLSLTGCGEYAGRRLVVYRSTQESALLYRRRSESYHSDCEPPNSNQRMTAMVSQTSNLKAIVSEDGAVILDIERDSMSTLNPTGAYVWQGLQRGETIETIIANLARDTGEDHLLVERDLREFVAELQQKHLIPR
jgi:hypothetical protein